MHITVTAAEACSVKISKRMDLRCFRVSPFVCRINLRTIYACFGRNCAMMKQGIPPVEECHMAKSQKKSNKEVRKPKAEKAPKTNASNPSSKSASVGIVTIKD
jgi:hypothetical protein